MATNKSRKTSQTSNSPKVNLRAHRHARYEISNKAAGHVVRAGITNRLSTAGAKSVSHGKGNLTIKSSGTAHRARVERAARSAITLHWNALKELERH